MKFYECKTCGNIMILLEDSGVIPVCCGSTMSELIPQAKDGNYEAHVPVIDIGEDNVATIRVGSRNHPMDKDHYIKWIILETNMGKYMRYLSPGNEPMTKIKLNRNEKVCRIYEFCNIHSLWVKEYEEEGC